MGDQVPKPVPPPADRPVPSASGATCVYVVGMHRSGTSAVTALLARLGLALPADDLLRVTRSNETGHWESRRIVECNQALLARLGGSWSAPPDLEAGWQSDPSLDAVRARAGTILATTFPVRPLVWKDPRICILLPFWQAMVAPPTAAVFVYRDPLEVAGSLHTRDGFTISHGLALWERYLRSAYGNLVGLPTLLVSYGQALDDPAQFARDLIGFLHDVGVTVGTDQEHSAADVLQTRLRHQRSDDGDGPTLRRDQQDLVDALVQLHGSHHPWQPPALGREPDWVGEILSMRRDLEMAQRTIKGIYASRAYRATQSMARWRDAVMGRRP